MKKKFLIAGGGTGGHIYPGIAIAKAIENLDPNIEVEFVGTSLGLEKTIVPREGYELHLISGGKLNYKGSLFKKALGLLNVAIGLCQSLFLILKIKPCGVLGVGGYASAPLVLMASLLRVPTSIWEPNAHPGLANRILSRFVSRAFVVFEVAKKYLHSKEIQLVGLPVRSELETVAEKRISLEKSTASSSLSLSTPSLSSVESSPSVNDFHVLCFGGSQGSRAINEVLELAVTKELPWLHKSKLIHQTGVSDYPKVKSSYDQSVFDVEAFEYLFEMEKYYMWAHVAICRSGASTLAELATVGMPAILIPLPTSADDHQRKNAEALAVHNAAIVIEQKDFTAEKLNEVLLNLQGNPSLLKNLSRSIKSLHKPFAAQVIAKSLLQIDSTEKDRLHR